jgi:ketosteroid isomerase-like protein
MKKMLTLATISLFLSFYGCGGGESETKKEESGSSEAGGNTDAVMNLTAESAENKAQRDAFIAVAVEGLKNQGNPEFQLTVTYLKVKGNYAFLKAEAKNKDGSDIITEGEAVDCCHVEVFMRKDDGKWYSVASNAFSTDLWYGCLWKEKSAPKEIFDVALECN